MVAGRNSRRLAAAIATAAASGAVPIPWFESGVVATVTAGAGYGGSTLVEVTWRGGTYPTPYLDTYAPTVGHTVLLLVQPPQLVILGRVVGRPA